MKNPVGGLPRRATIVRKLKEKQPDLIAVEFGDFINGAGKLDRIKAKTYLKSLEYMKYDAVVLDSSSFQAGVDFLREMMEKSPVDFVSLNAVYPDSDELAAKPFVIKNVGGLRVALTGLTGSELVMKPPQQSHDFERSVSDSTIKQASQRIGKDIKVVDPLTALEKYLPLLREKAQIIVLLSSLTQEKNKEIITRFPSVNVMIINDKEAPSSLADSPVLVFRNIGAKGKELGRISLTVNDENSIVEPMVAWFRLTKTYAEDETALKILENFYQTVAEDEELWQNIKPVLGSLPLESEPSNQYVGGAQCAPCHEQIYQSWKKTRHARAFTTLASENRHFYPDCVVCHTTGAGSASGYKIGQNAANLEGVQCEVCHGPGNKHISTEGDFDLRVEIPGNLCAQCHTKEISPAFTNDFQELQKKVNHSDVQDDSMTVGTMEKESVGKEGS